MESLAKYMAAAMIFFTSIGITIDILFFIFLLLFSRFINKSIFMFASSAFYIASGILTFICILSFAAFAKVGILNSHQEKYLNSTRNEFQITKTDFIESNCEIKSVCEKFKLVKNDCASSNNINACLMIKMDGQDFTKCKLDGTMINLEPSSRPTSFQCSVIGISNFMKNYMPMYNEDQYQILINGNFGLNLTR